MRQPPTTRHLDRLDFSKTSSAKNRAAGSLNQAKSRSGERRRKAAKEEIGERVATSVDQLVKASLDALKYQEDRDRRAAYAWHGGGFATLVAAVAVGIWRAVELPLIGDWLVLCQVGLIAVPMLAASNYCFRLGNAFMAGALRNADRYHAINSGRLYLRLSPERVEWSEMKEAFQHWSVDKEPSVMKCDVATYDPKLLERAVELLSKALVVVGKRGADG